jgi:hypothetical protein
MLRVKCYDNGGETFDRYTVFFLKKNNKHFDYIGMSKYPTHPQGFGQWGECKIIPCSPNAGPIGKQIPFSALPDECKNLVNRFRGGCMTQEQVCKNLTGNATAQATAPPHDKP